MNGAWWREKSASEQATLVARVVSHAALVALVLRLYTTSETLVTAGSIGLGAAVAILVVAFALAAREATGVCRPLYAGAALATLFGALSQLYTVVAYVLPGRTPQLVDPSSCSWCSV